MDFTLRKNVGEAKPTNKRALSKTSKFNVHFCKSLQLVGGLCPSKSLKRRHRQCYRNVTNYRNASNGRDRRGIAVRPLRYLSSPPPNPLPCSLEKSLNDTLFRRAVLPMDCCLIRRCRMCLMKTFIHQNSCSS